MIHITSGDGAGERLARAGLPGEVRVWHDVLYDGPRVPGWPDAATLDARADFLDSSTGGGIGWTHVRATLDEQYDLLRHAASGPLVLWFDACLFDQAMLAHVLACLASLSATRVELIGVDTYEGIEPFHGLGQLEPDMFAALYPTRRVVTREQYAYAIEVDRAFATQNATMFAALARESAAPLPAMPAAVARWIEEQADPVTGLGRLESLVLEAVAAGCATPAAVMAAVKAADRPPCYWGDTTLWAVINRLADRTPARIIIDGPAPRLPQWHTQGDVGSFRLTSGG